MRAEVDDREGGWARHGFAFEVGCAVTPTAKPGKAEPHVFLGRMVKFIGRAVVAHVVGTVVGEIEVASGGVEIKADGITHPGGKNFRREHARCDSSRACRGVEAHDGAFQAVCQTDVARRADGDIQLPVGAEARIAPTVPGIVGEFVEQDLRFAWARVLMFGAL